MQKKGFSRREFISLAGATGGAALLAACQGVAPAADSGAGGDASPETVTGSVQSGWQTGSDSDVWTPCIELFDEKGTHISIDMIRLHVSPEDTMTAVPAAPHRTYTIATSAVSPS